MRSIEIACELAEDFEGLSLEPYICPGGFPTVGYGHLLSRKRNADLSQWDPITHEEASRFLQQDLMKSYRSVQRLIQVPLNDNQEAALIDFCYNCGSGNLQASTLRKVINRGEYDEAPAQFRRWVYAGGRRLRGLIRRREAEATLFCSPAHQA